MTLSIVRSFLSAAAATVGFSSTAMACGCGGVMSSITAFKNSDLVFVGKIVSADPPKAPPRKNVPGYGSGASSGAAIVTFEVTHMYSGSAAPRIVIVNGGVDCDEPFAKNEVWLVYAKLQNGRVTASKCSRTRLVANASSDLTYLDGIEQRRPQGILYGEVLRRITDAKGQPALQGLFEPMQVIAASNGRRVEATTDPGGYYQMVLPPGDYTVSVERKGQPVGETQSVHIAEGKDQQLRLIANY